MCFKVIGAMKTSWWYFMMNFFFTSNRNFYYHTYILFFLLLIPVTFKWSSTTLTIRLKVLWPKIEEINVNIHSIHTAYVFAVICQWKWETNVDDFYDQLDTCLPYIHAFVHDMQHYQWKWQSDIANKNKKT